MLCFFFQAEDGIRGLVRSRGLGDVYKRQGHPPGCAPRSPLPEIQPPLLPIEAAGSGADLASYTYKIILSWI